MGKFQALFLFATAVCLLSLAGVAHGAAPAPSPSGDTFSVQGQVYCDTCRIQFITRVSHVIEGATVRLECRNITAGTESYKAEAKTDKLGMYSFNVDGDYEDDICEVVLVKSPTDDCNEIPNDAYSEQAAKISLTSNNGEATPLRNANPLGFMRKNPLPECPEVLKELDLDGDGQSTEGN